jgi:hypothetical protein
VVERQNPNEVTQGRLVRYTEVNGMADPNSEWIIIGDQWGNGFPSCSSTHNVGSVVFGLDGILRLFFFSLSHEALFFSTLCIIGTLFVNGGDGAHFENVDDGNSEFYVPFSSFLNISAFFRRQPLPRVRSILRSGVWS